MKRMKIVGHVVLVAALFCGTSQLAFSSSAAEACNMYEEITKSFPFGISLESVRNILGSEHPLKLVSGGEGSPTSTYETSWLYYKITVIANSDNTVHEASFSGVDCSSVRR